MSPQERLNRLRGGEDPSLVTELASGFVILSQTQYLTGYCLLLAFPMVGQLNDLEGEPRTAFLEDTARLGDAVKLVTRCKRINYGIYGNVDPFLHAHVWPRYGDESAELSSLPPLSFPVDFREDPAHAFSIERHGSLLTELREALRSR